MSQKIKITVQRGENGAPGVVEYDEFVLVGWNVNELSGNSQALVQTSAPPGEDSEHLLLASQVLSRTMKTRTTTVRLLAPLLAALVLAACGVKTRGPALTARQPAPDLATGACCTAGGRAVAEVSATQVLEQLGGLAVGVPL